jgi:hypothetical protein
MPGVASPSGNGAGRPAGQRLGTPQVSSQSTICCSPVRGQNVNGCQAKATTQTWTQSRPSALASAISPAAASLPGHDGGASFMPSGRPSRRPARTIGISCAIPP